MASGTINIPQYNSPTRLTNITGVADVTIAENRTYRIGKLVVVSIRFTLTATANANSAIIQGLPQPASSLSASSAIVALACNRAGVPFAMVGSGEIMPTVNATAQMYVVSGCYISV